MNISYSLMSMAKQQIRGIKKYFIISKLFFVFPMKINVKGEILLLTCFLLLKDLKNKIIKSDFVAYKQSTEGRD